MPSQIVPSRFLLCEKSHLNKVVQLVIEDGGEGVILRKIGSLYEQGRSQSLLKFKVHLILITHSILYSFVTFFVILYQASLEDKEAVVVGVTYKSIQLKL